MLHRNLMYLFLLLSFSVYGTESAIVLTETDTEIEILARSGGLYLAAPGSREMSDVATDAPIAPVDPAAFVANLKKVDQVDQVAGGSYWLYTKIDNQTKNKEWVLSPFNALIDRVHVYLYRPQGVSHFHAGYLYPTSTTCTMV